jgi:hypothetical protein
MARPFDQASDRYFIPSTSSGSSSESSGPSLSSPPLGLSHLPRDIDNLHLTRPDSQPLGHNEPVIKLGRMADRLDDDTMMLDDWEEEGKRGERDHGKHNSRNLFRFSFPFLAPSGVRHLMREVCNNGLVNGERDVRYVCNSGISRSQQPCR